ncbi:MAG: putative DNA binding domain-containing protein [Chloroflexota bacterium]|nr:putative DNA binding domain-containing protein [Chloroflexota bacterium]
MLKSELLELIAGGEDSYTEFKLDISQRSDLAGEMVAFANTDGGQLLVGIDDDGAIVGVVNPQQTEEAVVNIARNNCVAPLTPLIDRIDIDGQIIVVVQILRRSGAPHENNSGQCFIRVGSSKRLCTPQERARMLQAASLVHFDESPVARTTGADLDLEAFAKYYQRIYEQPFRDADVPLVSMLENMRFLVADLQGASRLSLAGLLLFAKRPQDFLYYARISAVRWAGLEAGETIIDRQEIIGRLDQQIEQAEAFILRNTRLSTQINSVRQSDQPEYPRPALREVLVNAVAHRDYSLAGAQILLYIFDDRIEMRSPGTLPNSVTLANIRTHYSRPRNETIARVLFNLGYVNTLGSGIPRIIRLMQAQGGRPPDFEPGTAQFLVRLWSSHWQTFQNDSPEASAK